jgi:2-polyprenyl-6-methoxyphenol hydroxylase-like FAD-dependent oxidoreductase
VRNETTSVLVVGGSSVGLTAALQLARQGVHTTVVERRDGVSIHPRALGLGLRATEVLQAAGLTEQLRAVQKPDTVAIGRIDVERVVGTDFASSEGRRSPLTVSERAAFREFSPASTGNLSQDRLDPILLAAAEKYGATIHFGTELTSLDQDDHGVRATVGTGDQTRLIEADYLVAADGANSRVRAMVGIPFSGPGKLAEGYFVNTLFQADLSDLIPPAAFGMCGIQNDEVGGILIAVTYPDRWLFHIMDQKSDDYLAQVRAAIGVPDLDVQILSTLPWRSTLALADRYREGRVFLVGDAAHVMPPTGGFGLNTGIPDADNLAWKLALAGRGYVRLLDSYEAERRPQAQYVQQQVMLRAQHMHLHWDATKHAERAALGIAEFTVAQLGYPQVSDVIVDPPRTDVVDRADPVANLDGAPGTRVPHRWLDIDGQRVSTVELAGPEFVLYADKAWTAEAHKVAETLDVGLRTYPGEGAMLVRPDGIVAWRTKEPTADPAQAFEAALSTAIGR